VTAPVLIERQDSITDDVRALIFELDGELAVAYPPEQLHGLTLRSLFEPHVRFFIARLDGAAVGCGAIAFFDGFAEVKRMYVRKSARGAGVAQALLDHIEAVAREAGVELLRLETGVRQPAAIRLYESFASTRARRSRRTPRWRRRRSSTACSTRSGWARLRAQVPAGAEAGTPSADYSGGIKRIVERSRVGRHRRRARRRCRRPAVTPRWATVTPWRPSCAGRRATA